MTHIAAALTAWDAESRAWAHCLWGRCSPFTGGEPSACLRLSGLSKTTRLLGGVSPRPADGPSMVSLIDEPPGCSLWTSELVESRLGQSEWVLGCSGRQFQVSTAWVDCPTEALRAASVKVGLRSRVN